MKKIKRFEIDKEFNWKSCRSSGSRLAFFHQTCKDREHCNKIVDTIAKCITVWNVIKSFRHKGLSELFERGNSRRVRQDLHSRCLRCLDVLDQSEVLSDLKVPGFNFHGLRGVPKRYSIHVNGPWCITFEFTNGEARKVDLDHSNKCSSNQV